MTIPKAIAYSPRTTTSSVTAIDAVAVEVTAISSFPTLSAGEVGIVVFCADVNFRSTDPADYETATYTGITESTLTGLTREVEGTAREWASGTAVASFGTAYGWEQVRGDARWTNTRDPNAHTLTEDKHTVSGLTAGHFLKATGETTFGFAAHGLSKSDVGLANVTNDAQLPLGGGTMTGTIACNDNLITMPDLKDAVETLATATWDSASRSIDLTNGNVHSVSITAAVTTLTFTNARAGAHSFTLRLSQGGTLRAVTWPLTAAQWAGGAAPTMAINKTYWMTFVTIDGGTNWNGFLAGEI